jgi:hypothetical protein
LFCFFFFLHHAHTKQHEKAGKTVESHYPCGFQPSHHKKKAGEGKEVINTNRTAPELFKEVMKSNTHRYVATQARTDYLCRSCNDLF